MIDLEGGARQLLGKLQSKASPSIPLGSKGTFAEGEMTVIGFLQRSAWVDGGWYPFEEYLLFDPKIGFRWLVQSDLSWSYVQPVATGAVEYGGNTCTYDKVKFRVFQSRTQLRVDHVYGELYWRVTENEMVYGEDFIAPPAMLSREETGNEENWSLSTYLTIDQVKAAFPDKQLELGRESAIAPNRPYPIRGFGLVASLAVAALIVVAIVAGAMAKNTVVYTHAMTVGRAGTMTATGTAPATTAEIRPATVDTRAPPACLDYSELVTAFAGCDKAPLESRNAMKQALDALRSQWTDGPADMRDQIANACQQAIDAIRQVMATANCPLPNDLPLPPPPPAAPPAAAVPDLCLEYESVAKVYGGCTKLPKAKRDAVVAELASRRALWAGNKALPAKQLQTTCKTFVDTIRKNAQTAGCPLPAAAATKLGSGSGAPGSGSGSAASPPAGSGSARSGSATPASGSGSAAPPADVPTEIPGSTFFSDPFELSHHNIELEFTAGINNNWVYFAADLVEEATGKVVSFDDNIEFYSGVDDGEGWSEGSHEASQFLGPLPAGKYVLRIEAQQGGSNDVTLNVKIRQGIFRWRYFFLALGVLMVPFLIFGIHEWSFERRRWDNSTFGSEGAPKLASTYMILAFTGLFIGLWYLLKGAFVLLGAVAEASSDD
jgi:hypothetical protein